VSASLRSLVSPPAAGFDQPFEMLQACHERMQRTLDLLLRLRSHLREHGGDLQAQQAARDVMRYFDLAAPQHHRDEELHVFPPLLARGDERLRSIIVRLQQDHVAMEAGWKSAREVLARVAEGGASRLAEAHEAALEAFVSLYGEHIAIEEELAYPAARQLLDADALASAGAEMARRRGADPDPARR
jgi:hemerythrin-like domain-containing protein